VTPRLSTIGELISPIQTWNPLSSSEDGTFCYIDLSSIDNEAKAVRSTQKVRFKDAPSRARQLVKQGDIVVSTVRPNLNGVAKLDEQHDGATASTGFCVLRPDPEVVCSNYLFQWVKSPEFVSDMTRKATGQSYPAVSDRIIAQSIIPLPSLAEQRRIAAILDRADDLRRKRREALALLQSVNRVIFLQMFGDPIANNLAWPIVRLGELGSLDRGVSKHRPRNDPALLGGPYPLIQTGEVTNSDGYIRDFTSTYSELGLRQGKLWPRGTLCITIAANIGKTAILAFDACFPDSVVGFVPKTDVRTEFVQQWLAFVQPTLERDAPQFAQKNINLAILRELKVIRPPLDLQGVFAARIAEIDKLKAHHRAHLARLDALFASLQHRAFRGEL
jgi:type I restriction enzyme S subunit